MAETAVATPEPQQQVQAPEPSPFGQQAWTETPPPASTEAKVEPKTADTPAPIQAAPIETPSTDEEILEQNDWIKRELGFDNVETAKKEIEEYRTYKKNPTVQEIKFADDQSKQIHELIRDGKTKEVREFLETQEKLQAYSTATVDQDSAEDIIKLSIQLKNKNLTSKEVDFQYKQEYVAPKEPVQRATEDNDDFAERVAEWKERAEQIVMKRVIAAKMAQPELEKLKTQVTLPELIKPQAQPVSQEPTPESLAEAKKSRDSYLQSLESTYTKAEGFKTQVKDESVEIPIAFNIPDAEKIATMESLKNFDVSDYMDKRWFDESGNPRIEQMMRDRYILENLDKVLSGVANNAASLRMTHHFKSQSNIQIKDSNSQQVFQPKQQENGQTVSPFSVGAWSEKAPTINQN